MRITKTIELIQFCNSILDADRNVRSVAIIDKKGEMLHSTIHNRVTQSSFERWNDIYYMECMFDIPWE